MTAQEFDAILGRRLEKTRLVLSVKAGEYATGADRLHNFKRAAELTRTTQAKALLGMLAKHLVSVVDVVEAHDTESLAPGAVIDEKIGDAVNYLVLLEAVLREGRPI